jgi:putative holliday junction resolvase
MAKSLGIDYGLKRIGIALSDESGTIAFGKEVIINDNACYKKIAAIVKENDVVTVVIGLPVKMNNEPTEQTVVTQKFITALRLKLPAEVSVVSWDERMTSKIAGDQLLESGMKKMKRQDKSHLDKLSAAIILQDFLDASKNKERHHH